MQIQKAYRGISKRLAIHYLSGLGGTPLDEAGDPVDDAGEETAQAERVERVTSDTWSAHLDTRTVAVGGTLQLTEIQIRFESDDDDAEAVLSELVEAFSQKAMRAGG